MTKKKYNINSFFAGIGGFDVAFEQSGFKTQLLCEISPFCNQILSRHWPKVRKELDINGIDLDHIPNADVWCGGFPCQDISLARGASARLGLNGKRSGLFYRFADLISLKKPQVVIIENVGGLFTSNKGRDFGVILQTMSAILAILRLARSRFCCSDFVIKQILYFLRLKASVRPGAEKFCRRAEHKAQFASRGRGLPKQVPLRLSWSTCRNRQIPLVPCRQFPRLWSL